MSGEMSRTKDHYCNFWEFIIEDLMAEHEEQVAEEMRLRRRWSGVSGGSEGGRKDRIVTTSARLDEHTITPLLGNSCLSGRKNAIKFIKALYATVERYEGVTLECETSIDGSGETFSGDYYGTIHLSITGPKKLRHELSMLEYIKDCLGTPDRPTSTSTMTMTHVFFLNSKSLSWSSYYSGHSDGSAMNDRLQAELVSVCLKNGYSLRMDSFGYHVELDPKFNSVL